MSSKAARREYLQALADFERGCRDFARGMATVLDATAPAAAGDAVRDEPLPLFAELGPRRPAKRADALPEAARARVPKEAGSRG